MNVKAGRVLWALLLWCSGVALPLAVRAEAGPPALEFMATESPSFGRPVTLRTRSAAPSEAAVDTRFWQRFGDRREAFSRVDQRVRDIGYPKDLSLDELARRLVADLTSDLDKTYALYRWITANIEYEVEALFGGKVDAKGGPAATLRRGRGVCGGFAELFASMGQAVGLRIITITGVAKGLNVDEHAWNAVLLGNTWHLTDATWDAGHVDTARRAFVRNVGRLKYFLADPSRMITSHLPSVPGWQLLPKTVDEKTFQAMVKVRPDMDEFGIDVRVHPWQLLQAQEAPLALDFGPMAKLAQAALYDESGNLLNGRWSFLRREADGRVRLLLSAPKAGTYNVTIFAKRAWADPISSGVLHYRLTLAKPPQVREPFPQTFPALDEHAGDLIEPVVGRLSSAAQARFRLRLPGANQVQVAQQGRMVGSLARDGEHFVGELQLLPGEATLFAGFGEGDGAGPLKGLARFQVD